MFGRVFGKRSAPERPAQVPPHPGPDADGVTRAFPKAIFDGPQGEFLRTLGFSPDDPSNVMPTQQSVQAKADAIKAEQDQLVAAVNRELPGDVQVLPWAMIPYAVWGREPATFLMVTCDFYPASRLNTMLLAADEKSSEQLGLPAHPRGGPQGLNEAALKVLGELEAEYTAEHQKVSAALLRGDISLLSGVTETQERFAGQVAGLARFLGSKTFGNTTWTRHEELFADWLWTRRA